MPADPPILELFPRATPAPPATEQSIVAVEAELGIRLPAQLRRLYLESDGFRVDLGHARYLFSLAEPPTINESLLSTTRFYWDEWPEYFPQLDLRPFVFFGSSGSNYVWAIDWARGEQIIRYHHHLAAEYEIAGADILDVWRRDYAEYETVA